MRISLSAESITNAAVDLVAVGVRSAKISKGGVLEQVNKALGGDLAEHIKDEGFEAKVGQVLKIPTKGKWKAKWIAVVGLPKAPVAAARTLGHAAAKSASRRKSVAALLPNDEVDEETIRAASEGIVTGAYRYLLNKTSKQDKVTLNKALVLVPSARKASFKKAVDHGVAIGESINVARDLVNGPPNLINPLTLASAATRNAKKHGVKCTVWNKKRIEREKMELFLAVNAGSAIEPRLIHMTYEPPKSVATVAFVGKGLTFDAGGLCIKPAKSMVDMKCDMAGGAATIGIVLAAARLGLPVTVHGIVGSTENMTGAAAYRPGDVFKSYSGKTVEIINTDAEGRLVLADVLAWTRKTIDPDILIDHATLTGACMVALGPYRAGLYTDDEKLASGYEKAAKVTGENFWRLPLDRELRPGLDSFVADLKHTGGAHGGSITAALFLREFVGQGRWMHLDIAGPAFNDRPHKLTPKGGTGFGVATAVKFLESLG